MKDHIVIYVHRTGLLSYYINPICEFLVKQYQIVILHLDRRNGYHYASKDSTLYKQIDLSDKNVSEIKKLLLSLHPKVFISLGYVSIFELLMLRICKTMGIRTLFLEHGLYSKETSSLPYGKLITKFGTTVKKNLFFIYRYLQFIISSEHPQKELSIFWNCFRKKKYSLSKFDKALFFAEYGYKKISELFHYSKDEVVFICYPLAKTNSEFDKYKEIAKLKNSKECKATFIHQPFILDGLAHWSYDEEKEFFLQLQETIGIYGYKLSIQVHPREDLERYVKLFSETGIEVMQGMEREKFKDYSLVIGNYSTALLYPIYFKIPVMIMGYPHVCNAEDSTFYPISCTLPIKDEKSLIEKYDSFCKEYLSIGNCSFENIAEKLAASIEASYKTL